MAAPFSALLSNLAIPMREHMFMMIVIMVKMVIMVMVLLVKVVQVESCVW